MSSPRTSDLAQHFLAHQRLWIAGLLLTWATLNVTVLATSVILEDLRDGTSYAFWEPFCWEVTSVVMLLALIPMLVFIYDGFLSKLALTKQLLIHLLLTIPASAIHVAGMVLLRELCYAWAGSDYQFGHLPYELLYEYRKDFQSYITIAVVIASYRFIVRRMRGEASIVNEGEDEHVIHSDIQKTQRLLVKKLGKEFLVKVNDIEWIEAAGNYANLHIGNGLYPIRMTMTKLEQALPIDTFARIHRSYIVNLNKVKTLNPLDTGDYQVTLDDETTLNLSRRYRDQFKARVNSY